MRSLRALEGLPIWLVIRLCTDEDDVTDFYNKLDGKLELSLEVLDDFMGEAKEVSKKNPWLNYAIPMHRCRELGYHDRLFDLIDERPLTKEELRDFCVLLFGQQYQDIPNPLSSWNDFISYVEDRLRSEKDQWNPMTKKLMPWINVKKLKRIYGDQHVSSSDAIDYIYSWPFFNFVVLALIKCSSSSLGDIMCSAMDEYEAFKRVPSKRWRKTRLLDLPSPIRGPSGCAPFHQSSQMQYNFHLC